MKKHLSYTYDKEGYRDVLDTLKVAEKVSATEIHFLKSRSKILKQYLRSVLIMLRRLTVPYDSSGAFRSTKTEDSDRHSLLVIMGRRGLVGGLYHKEIRLFLEHAERYKVIYSVGERAKKYLSEEGVVVSEAFSDLSDFPEARESEGILKILTRKHKLGEIDSMDVLYPRFVSLSEQHASIVRVFPLDFENIQEFFSEELESEPEYSSHAGLPIFEPSRQMLFELLSKKYLDGLLHQIVLESKLSEMSARTVTCEQAASKTEDIIRSLVLTARREQSREMTQRQLERFGHLRKINSQSVSGGGVVGVSVRGA